MLSEEVDNSGPSGKFNADDRAAEPNGGYCSKISSQGVDTLS